MPMVNSSLGVHIYIHITVYQFALLYVRSQPNSTTWSSDNYRLFYRELRLGEKSKEVSIYLLFP